ncbi:MAG: PA2169 family four-helix-bundle protein [Acidobacteriota bacterium]
MGTTHPDTPSNEDSISKLNGLIEICKDGQNGFKDAAEGVENSELKTIFYEYSQQRSEFVGTLQGLVRSLGGDPEQSGSISGAIHRGWIDIKSAITGRDEEAILNECERGEDYAKEAYLDATKFAFPSNVRDVIEEQRQKVVQAHDRIKKLRNSRRQSATTGS